MRSNGPLANKEVAMGGHGWPWVARWPATNGPEWPKVAVWSAESRSPSQISLLADLASSAAAECIAMAVSAVSRSGFRSKIMCLSVSNFR
jgi:hypothetical protein